MALVAAEVAALGVPGLFVPGPGLPHWGTSGWVGWQGQPLPWAVSPGGSSDSRARATGHLQQAEPGSAPPAVFPVGPRPLLVRRRAGPPRPHPGPGRRAGRPLRLLVPTLSHDLEAPGVREQQTRGEGSSLAGPPCRPHMLPFLRSNPPAARLAQGHRACHIPVVCRRHAEMPMRTQVALKGDPVTPAQTRPQDSGR